MMDKGNAWVQNIEDVELKDVSWLAGKWRRIVDLSQTGQRGLIFSVGRLEPGEVADWHEHHEDEVFFVFKGHGVVRWRIGEDVFEEPVEPGSAFFKVGGIPHQMAVVGDEALIAIGCKV
jgi:quercetin dioxygenase-like cupin family protein